MLNILCYFTESSQLILKEIDLVTQDQWSHVLNSYLNDSKTEQEKAVQYQQWSAPRYRYGYWQTPPLVSAPPPPKWEMDLEQYPESNMISAFKDHSIFLVTNHFGVYFQLPFLGSTFSCFRQKSFRISENECAFSGVYIQMKLCLVFITFYF